MDAHLRGNYGLLEEMSNMDLFRDADEQIGSELFGEGPSEEITPGEEFAGMRIVGPPEFLYPPSEEEDLTSELNRQQFDWLTQQLELSVSP